MWENEQIYVHPQFVRTTIRRLKNWPVIFLSYTHTKYPSKIKPRQEVHGPHIAHPRKQSMNTF